MHSLAEYACIHRNLGNSKASLILSLFSSQRSGGEPRGLNSATPALASADCVSLAASVVKFRDQKQILRLQYRYSYLCVNTNGDA